MNLQILLSYAKASCRVSCIWGRLAALAWERPLPPALITHLNVNKACLVIQLSGRCMHLSTIVEHLGHMVSHLKSLETNIYLNNSEISQWPPVPGIYWQDQIWGNAYVISSGGTVQSLLKLALSTKLILTILWLPGLNAGQFPPSLFIY